jgi:KDO2-lipid IV(A) lauroyltransferase
VEESVTAMNDAIEQLVKKNPAQYQWEYKRFKKPPEGGTDPYR